MHHSTPPPIGGEGAGGAVAGAKSRFAGKTAPLNAPCTTSNGATLSNK
ncbi:hypothetical protein [Snodgrassella sp. CS2]